VSSLERARDFFAPRAATWDARFPDDAPAFAGAVRALRLPVGGAVLDAGCGTGRAVTLLRDAVGSAGTVVGVDATPEMLAAAHGAARGAYAAFVLGDAGWSLVEIDDAESRYLAVARRV
jgi:ubiquinone/menaquinone biosynthesis C-methylase UbiE